MADSLTTKQLAGLHNVSIRTVESWCRRGLPFEKQGRERLFDSTTVTNWLAAEDLLPGARGREGAKSRWGQRADDSGVPLTYENGNGELGLEAALERIRRIEMSIGESIEAHLRGEQAGDALVITAKLKHYKEIVNELRQCERGLIEVQELRGDVVRREEMLGSLTSLAALFRSSLERFPTEITGRVVAALGDSGAEVPDMAAFQRALSAQARRCVDDWLRELSEQIR